MVVEVAEVLEPDLEQDLQVVGGLPPDLHRPRVALGVLQHDVGQREGRGLRDHELRLLGRAGGDRPGQAEVDRVLRAALLIAMLLAALGAIGPWRGAVLDRLGSVTDPVRRIVSPRFEPVNPIGAVASAELPGEIGVSAVDGFSNTSWAAPVSGEPTLTVAFAEPVDVGQIGVTNGAPGEAFRSRARPRVVRLIASDGRGDGDRAGRLAGVPDLPCRRPRDHRAAAAGHLVVPGGRRGRDGPVGGRVLPPRLAPWAAHRAARVQRSASVRRWPTSSGQSSISKSKRSASWGPAHSQRCASATAAATSGPVAMAGCDHQSSSSTGRTSTPPKVIGTCLAMAIAWSRSAASMTM